MVSHLMSLVIVILAWQACPCTGEVNTTWMREKLTQHFSQPRHHVTNPGYKKRAMIFIRDQFRAMGLETHLHLFPTALNNVTGINVIGLLKGRYFNTANDKIAGIGAHYDTMRHTPGVDDNGAAVVVMLQAAMELSRQQHRDYTMLFIAFDFEEWEYANNYLVACHNISCGSMSLVKQWLPNFFTIPLGWKGMYIMDTIMNFDTKGGSQHFPAGIGQVFPSQAHNIQADGDRGDFLMIAGRREDQNILDSFNTTWAGLGQPQYEIEEFVVPKISQEFESFLRSDHVSFWSVGWNAVFISDTADFRGYMTKCYHQSCDTIQRVTPSMLDFAAKTCRTLISALNNMASATSASCQQLGNTPVMLILILAVLMLWQNK